MSGLMDHFQTNNPTKAALCFHSVDALLAQTGLDTTFNFFHSLTSRIADSDTITATGTLLKSANGN
ncbi:DUF7504 family protein [Natronorubrum sp. FCH18a]|uniref:DUF7504 family protein n=1 Tax=Natronorubrum sp. FCH18a TaxID=3447018 RepID=UPI003F517658